MTTSGLQSGSALLRLHTKFSYLASRLISIPLAILLSADPFLFLLAVAVILAFGPGKFSIDFLLGKKFGYRP